MIHQRYRSTAALSLLTDIAATLLAFATAWYVRFETTIIPWLEVDPDPPFGPYLRLLPFVLLAWPTVFFFQGLYQSKLGKSRVEQTVSIVIAVVFASLLLNGLSSWYRPAYPTNPSQPFTFSRAFMAIFSLASVFYTGAGRFSVQAFVRRRRRQGHGLRRILVIGGGRLGQEVTQKILAHQGLGFEVIGFLDDESKDPFLLGRPVLGTLEDLPSVLSKHEIDQVMIALPVDAYRKTMRILEQVGKECVDVRLVPDVLQYAALKATLEDLDGTPLINLSQVPLEGWNTLAKRFMDLLLTLGMLTVPVSGSTKLDVARPSQNRLGANADMPKNEGADRPVT